MIAGHTIPLWVIPFALIGWVFAYDLALSLLKLHRRRMEEVKKWQRTRNPW